MLFNPDEEDIKKILFQQGLREMRSMLLVLGYRSLLYR
jgi:hypothetical protein